jgi:hypothetical protein
MKKRDKRSRDVVPLRLCSCSKYLLPTVGGQVKDEHSQKRDAHAGDDEVDSVEERLPPHGDVEGDVQVGLVTACVELDIPEVHFLIFRLKTHTIMQGHIHVMTDSEIKIHEDRFICSENILNLKIKN